MGLGVMSWWFASFGVSVLRCFVYSCDFAVCGWLVGGVYVLGWWLR